MAQSVALEMFKDNEPIEKIARYTKLAIDKIKEIGISHGYINA